MPSRSFSDQVLSLALDLVWSVWAELGVSSWTRRHDLTAVDIEPLILATSYIGAHDARLMSESIDWCVAHGRLVSVARLRNQLRASGEIVAESFGRYAATVNRHGRATWPDSGVPLDFQPTNRSSSPDLTRPSLLQLRLRALFGVSARAEVIRLMIAEPARYQTVSELAGRAAYGKDNIADTLDLLTAGGLAEAAGAVNRKHFRLARPDRLVELVGTLPAEFPDWAPLFRIAIAILEFSLHAPQDPIPRAAEVPRVMRQIQPDMPKVGLLSALRATTGQGLVSDFEAWAIRALSTWARSETLPGSGAETTYSIHRLDFGGYGPWQGWIHEGDGTSRPIEMPEWDGLYIEHPRSDTTIADDSVGGPKLAHAIFEDAFRRVSVEIGRYWAEDPTNQLVCRQFADDQLRTLAPGGSTTFGEMFLRTWYADHKGTLSKRDVAVGPLGGVPT